MKSVVLLLGIAACHAPDLDARGELVVNTLAEDNFAWAVRDPDTVAMKLALMQQDPFDWLRGTAAIFWRDVMTPGADRPATAFGSPAASRVLLVADPHPENLGTFQAADGTMVVDWNDFDTAGYGPYEGDVRRLAAGLIIAAADPTISDDLARQVAAGYTTQLAAIAAGEPVTAVGVGAEPYLDSLITKAQKQGAEQKTLDEVAPVVDASGASGARAIAFGDLDPPDASGVITDRLEPVGADAAVAIATALAAWRAATMVPAAVATVKAQCRRLGSGVSSYAALRYFVIIEGATPSPDDDVLLELKEERDGLIIEGVPMLAVGEWASPSVRVVDTQHRLQARLDEDVLLGPGDALPLSFRVHDRTDYQRGVANGDLGALAAGSDDDRDQLRALAHRFGMMLARAHGLAQTEDGVAGWTVLEPVLVGREAAWADEVAAFAEADATQITADWRAFAGTDLAELVLPVEDR